MTLEPPPPSPGPSRSRPVRVAIGLLVVIVGVISLLAALGRDQAQQASTGNFQGVSDLVLDLDNAPVEITVGGDEVVVHKSVATGFTGGSSTEVQDGASLRVVHDCPNLIGFGCRGSYSITVPAGLSVSGHTSNGGISIAGVEGSIDVSTSNGILTLTDLSGPTVTARTSNGSITGTFLASPDVDVRTSNGAVSVSFVTTPTRVTVRTSNGSVEVAVPSDSPAYSVSASTSNGQTRTDIRTDPAATATIEVSSSNGNITVRYAD